MQLMQVNVIITVMFLQVNGQFKNTCTQEAMAIDIEQHDQIIEIIQKYFEKMHKIT